MELFESNDPKTQLLKRSALHREAIEEEAKLISARTEKILTTALVVGGALAATYLLVRQFSGKPKRHKKSKKIKIVAARPKDEEDDDDVTYEKPSSGIVAQLGTALASQATTFLLDLAKEKLMAYLESQANKIKSDERP
jgi:hypothetical protein